MKKSTGILMVGVFATAAFFASEAAAVVGEDEVIGIIDRVLNVIADFFDRIFSSLADAIKSIFSGDEGSKK